MQYISTLVLSIVITLTAITLIIMYKLYLLKQRYNKTVSTITNQDFERLIYSIQKIATHPSKKRYLIDFILKITATMLGVFVAFVINDCNNQNKVDNATKMRLHLMYLELKYNANLGKGYLDTYSKEEGIYFGKFNNFSVQEVLQDNNIFSLLAPHQIILINSYSEIMRTLDDINTEYYIYLVSSKNLDNNTALRNKLKEYSITFLATCNVFQTECKQYFDKDDYDHEKHSRVDKEIEKSKRLIENGKL